MRKPLRRYVVTWLAPWLLSAPAGCASQPPGEELVGVLQQALDLPNVQATITAPTQLSFPLSGLPGPGEDAYLTFKARIDGGPYTGGSAPLLFVWLNPPGGPLDPLGGLDDTRLVNKPLEMKLRRGERYPWCSGGSWRLLRSSDMVAGTPDPYAPKLTDVVNGDPYEFRLKVTDLIQPGTNQLAFQVNNNLINDPALQVMIEDIRVEYLSSAENNPVEVRPPWGGPGVWPPQVYQPHTTGADAYSLVVRPGGGMEVTVGETTYPIESEFSFPPMSTPDGRSFNRFIASDTPWNYNEPGFSVAVTRISCLPTKGPPCETWRVTGTGAAYTIERVIVPYSRYISVTDKITHLPSSGLDTLGIRLQHNTPLVGDGSSGTVYLAGNRLHWTPEFFASTTDYPENPTVFYSATGAGGIGLLARDDVFRAHARLFVDSPLYGSRPHFGTTSRVGLEDAHLGIPAGTTYENRWAIFPVATDDYWTFINRARHVLKVNFTIPGGFSFIDVKPATYTMSATARQEFVANRSLGMVSARLGKHWPPIWNNSGPYAHGLDFPTLLTDVTAPAPGEPANWIAAATTILDSYATASPGLKKLVYFNSYISLERPSSPIPPQYDADRMQDASLEHHYYLGDTQYPVFVPQLGSPYAARMEENLDLIKNTMNADGVFWDEMDHSYARYTYPDKDGHTVDTVLVKTSTESGYAVSAEYASVTLLTLDWRYQTAKALLAAGKVLVANGAPETEKMAKLHFPRYVETNGAPSLLHKTHLYTPIALGDFIWDFNDAAVARQIWERLEEGGLYYHYDADASLTYPKLTSHMFPFTPIEIRPGVLIGQERILTSRSGSFGWGDGTLPLAVHVFDEEGAEVSPAAYVTFSDGYTHVTLPYGYTAALVKDP